MVNAEMWGDKKSSIMPEVNIGIQERAEAFGPGDTKRVFEIVYEDFSIGINLGDIAHAPSEAVMCPTTKWIELGGGAIETRLASEIGDTLFRDYAQDASKMVDKVLRTEREDRLIAALALGNLMKEKGGIEIKASPVQVAADIVSSCEFSKSTGGEEQPTLLYGAAIPMPSGKLSEVGIKLIVLSNVTPNSSQSESNGIMTKWDMQTFTYNACKSADLIGVHSITIPSVGIGLATALGYGLSRQDSMSGFFAGAKRFADVLGKESSLKQIDYNIHAEPSRENTELVASVASHFSITELFV
jgi:hypothetical protein